ncbi:gas vesicle accessory protein GvpU [Halobacillus litoralis]|uniref:Gas vesicle protein GvpU n=1 Tax=Halobacillus litoralis TaxID=45668 RepID=A0A410MJ57_9BACI|nr:gas vesicle accessory protein GvpU [Halobacillus litoralis]QAS54685.1 gas vesicle protein GvpU [Halobacillus litoralis]
MDNLLKNFVKAANQHDFSLDITLNVDGALITGKTVSAQKYLEYLSNNFEDGNEISQTLSEQLAEASQREYDHDDVQYIHLENAQVYNGDSQPTPSEGDFYWRGKLQEIDGFFLGKIDAKTE